MKARTILTTLLGGVGIAGAADAAEIFVSANITTSETWTANNTYNLQEQIYVEPGATLTIEAGTVIASTTNLGGSLAICKGAQIFVNGTQLNPVIMTSTADVATWVGGNPKTGTWRAAANEWGNLTLMGEAYISENAAALGNSPTPSPSNVADMEGLVAGPAFDRYGGGDDNDDSGTISYLSLRYGGKVIGLNNELNGLSLGGIGRDTDIHHVDIMNNVDDGIEVWGGTVNLKYVNIWNIGDDSFDVDQGWRGKAQFGLIVQGYSVAAAQGSGVGDNAIETDGAEDSHWQPVTTATIYNFTVIGQPISGDHATAWRDNARVQYRNCIFMDLGERLVSFDNIDGDGANGYGFNGTLSWPATWTTPYTSFSTVNAPSNPQDFYTAQTSGMLAQITDSVFFRNLNSAAYTEATAQGVLNGSNNNVLIAGSAAADAPIQSITRGAPVTVGALTMLPVIALDPRPKNAATSSVGRAPVDGFFTPAKYRGAFGPDGQTWLCEWTASYAFGYTTACGSPATPFCFGDGTLSTPCPCGNTGQPGKGCDNSVGTGGAQLTATGSASLDTVVLTSSGELASVASVFLQGDNVNNSGIVFGDGVRCIAGQLKRLYTKNAVGGVVSAPVGGDPSIQTQSAILGDLIQPGATRYYQTHYRDPNLGFCANPPGNTWNVSSGLFIRW